VVVGFEGDACEALAAGGTRETEGEVLFSKRVKP